MKALIPKWQGNEIAYQGADVRIGPTHVTHRLQIQINGHDAGVVNDRTQALGAVPLSGSGVQNHRAAWSNAVGTVADR